jgi:hypothetical protein
VVLALALMVVVALVVSMSAALLCYRGWVLGCWWVLVVLLRAGHH